MFIKETIIFFRQLFEPLSSTYRYLLGCEETRQAILIDPVLPNWERDLCVIRDLGLTLAYSIDTHIHADHLTAAYKLKQEVDSKIAGPGLDQLPCTDIPLEKGHTSQILNSGLANQTYQAQINFAQVLKQTT